MIRSRVDGSVGWGVGDGGLMRWGVGGMVGCNVISERE